MHTLITIKNYLSLGWVGSALGLLGIVVAVIMAVATKKRSRLAYTSKGIHILGRIENFFQAKFRFLIEINKYPRRPQRRVSVVQRTARISWFCILSWLHRKQSIEKAFNRPQAA